MGWAENCKNISMHGFDSAGAGVVFESPILKKLDEREDYEE